MKIRFLGTNGWYATDTGNTLSIMIETDKEYIILDAGNGIQRIDRYITGQKPVYLFLSHFHLDHIEGFHMMVKFKFGQGMDIFGPPGIKKYLGMIMRQPFTVPFARLKMRTTVNDITRVKPPRLEMEYKELLHASVCYGYRFRLEDKIVVFCTDTGVCPNLISLARGADMLITECAFKPGMKDKKWPHLNPESAARVAKKAGAKQLALVHFDALLYRSLSERTAALRGAKRVFKKITAPRDGQTITL